MKNNKTMLIHQDSKDLEVILKDRFNLKMNDGYVRIGKEALDEVSDLFDLDKVVSNAVDMHAYLLDGKYEIYIPNDAEEIFETGEDLEWSLARHLYPGVEKIFKFENGEYAIINDTELVYIDKDSELGINIEESL